MDLGFGPDNCWLHVWQSRLEIECYSVMYFDRFAAFEALYRSAERHEAGRLPGERL